MPAPSDSRDLDATLDRLSHGATAFARAPIGDKVEWLREMGNRLYELGTEWVTAACHARSIDPDSPLAGQEWLLGPALVARNIRLLRETLESLSRYGAVRHPKEIVRERPGGGVAVEVVPRSRIDAAVFTGITCEVWLEPSVERGAIDEHRASFYGQRDPAGAVNLVLGAGNVSAIAAMDALHALFVEGRAVVLKANPVAEFAAPFIERVFAPLIERNAFALVGGGGEIGAYLCEHPAVSAIHITGSNSTHDRIVWGEPGPAQDERKQSGKPRLDKPITSELGNISPVLVVPAEFSDDDIEHTAQYVAGMFVHNASYNCNAAKMLVLPRGWGGSRRLVEAIGAVLAATPPRVAYYPGAVELHRSLTSGRERVFAFGGSGEGTLPWTLIPDLDERDPDEVLFRREPFCPVLGVVEVGSRDPVEFLDAATRFANERLWGTLNAMLFVHPRVHADPTLRRAVESAVAALRYGAIAINHWPAMIFGFGSPPWGAFPEKNLIDVQSGSGWAHNATMLERIEKAVLRGPFARFPKPIFFPGHRTVHRLGSKLAELEHAPSWKRLPGLLGAAVRG